MFIIENGGSRIINEMSLCQQFTASAKNKLINLLSEFIVQNFGLYPTKEQKIAVSKATIKLFPILRVKTSKLDGIVSRYIRFCVFENC